MHRTTEQRHLELANQHIEEAWARLDWLEGVLLEQQKKGLDASLAESLMENMKASLCMMVRYRLSIRRSLARAGLLATSWTASESGLLPATQDDALFVTNGDGHAG